MRERAGASGQQVSELQKELEATKARERKLLEELKKTKDMVSQSLKDADASSQRMAALQKELADLKKEVARLQKQHEADCLAREQETQKKLKDMTNHWTGQVRKEKDALGTELNRKHAENLDRERERLNKAREEAEAEAKRRLEEAMKQGMSEAGALHQEIERLRDEVAATKADAEAKQKAAAAAHTKQIQELEARNKAQISELISNHKRDLASAVQNAEKKLDALHKTELERMRQQHKRECEQLETEHASFCAALRSEGEAAVAGARAEEKTAAKAHAEALKQEWDDKWGQQLAAKVVEHTEQVSVFTKKVEELESAIQLRDSKLQTAAEQQAALQKELGAQQQKNASNLAEFEQWKVRTQDEESQRAALASEAHREELERLKSELEQALHESEQRCRDIEEDAEEKLTELEMRHAQLESKYNRRESRPEDVDKIKRLTEAVAEMQSEVDQTKEEMKYFKLELMNREENFNKNFGGGPNVGVMNPMSGIKTKAQSAGDSKRRKAAETSFPSIGSSAPPRPSSATRKAVGRRGSGSHAA